MNNQNKISKKENQVNNKKKYQINKKKMKQIHSNKNSIFKTRNPLQLMIFRMEILIKIFYSMEY